MDEGNGGVQALENGAFGEWARPLREYLRDASALARCRRPSYAPEPSARASRVLGMAGDCGERFGVSLDLSVAAARIAQLTARSGEQGAADGRCALLDLPATSTRVAASCRDGRRCPRRACRSGQDQGGSDHNVPGRRPEGRAGTGDTCRCAASASRQTAQTHAPAEAGRRLEAPPRGKCRLHFRTPAARATSRPRRPSGAETGEVKRLSL